MPKYPCPCCGFVVFDEQVGSYDICPLCGWEDDPVQLTYPGMAGGANTESLFDAQQKFVQTMPADRQLHRGFRRDPSWRPLRREEARTRSDQPNSGREYFDAIPFDGPAYYWKAS